MEIMKLLPSCKSYIWGGTKLKKMFNKNYSGDILAETWELSCHKDGSSIIASGDNKGTLFADYILNNKQVLGKKCEQFDDFPVLIKLIDANSNLSIQVHPNDEYSLKFEGQYGKTEMWYIVSCEENSYIYYGFNKTISKQEFKERIKNNTLLDVLNKVKVKEGDVFFIESGTIHAICSGIVIAEIQQNSNVTYRVYDYGRIGSDGKPRELHVEKAVDVTNTEVLKKQFDFGEHLGSCRYFTVDMLNIDNETEINVSEESFCSLLFVNGTAEIYTEQQRLECNAGDSIFIPSGIGKVYLKGNASLLKTYV